MTTTVASVYEAAGRLLGWRIGTLGTVTVGISGTSTAILNGLVGTTGSNSAYAGYRLIFPASPVGSQEAFVSTWVDATGLATFANQATAPVIGATYLLVPATDYTLNEINLAWADCQLQSRATDLTIIPITPNARLQYLETIDWLRGAGDVDAIYWNISPNSLNNEGFAKWWHGPAADPDSWTLSGVGASVVRTTGGYRTAFKATVTAGGGAAAELVQSLPKTLVQWIARRTAPVYTDMRAAAWLETASANSVRVGIRFTSAGVTSTTWSDFVTGDARPYFPEISRTPDANLTDISIVLQAAAGTTFSVSAAVFMQNTTAASNTYQLRDQGSQFYMEAIPNDRVRNWGTVPTIEFDRWPNVPGQIQVYSRRPLAQHAALDDVLDDQYAEAYKWGLLSWMLKTVKPNQDRSRLDRILYGDPRSGVIGAEAEWARFLANFTSLPVGDPAVQRVTMGA